MGGGGDLMEHFKNVCLLVHDIFTEWDHLRCLSFLRPSGALLEYIVGRNQ